MHQLADAHSKGPSRSVGWRSLAWVGGALATAAAIGVAAVLAVFFAATVLVIGLLSAGLIGLAGLAFRARKATHSADSTLIEARHVGGHSWVAYGWDQRGR